MALDCSLRFTGGAGPLEAAAADPGPADALADPGPADELAGFASTSSASEAESEPQPSEKERSSSPCKAGGRLASPSASALASLLSLCGNDQPLGELRSPCSSLDLPHFLCGLSQGGPCKFLAPQDMEVSKSGAQITKG